MFYLVEVEHIWSEEANELMNKLCCNPDDTILSQSTTICVPHLPYGKWVVWFDNSVSEEDIQIDGVIFTELSIDTTPDDDEWSWDDDYIAELFHGKIPVF